MPFQRIIPGGQKGSARDPKVITFNSPYPQRPEPTFLTTNSSHHCSTISKTIAPRYTGGFCEPPTSSAHANRPPIPQPERLPAPTQEPSKPAVPTEVFPLTRAQFQLIKCTHHLHQLEASFPPSLRRQSQRLADQLRPAFCTNDFRQAAAKLAKKWANDSVSLLREHYSAQLESAAQILTNDPVPAIHFDLSLRFACNWARKQLGRRLKTATLNRAVTHLKEIQERNPSAPEANTRTSDRTSAERCPPADEEVSTTATDTGSSLDDWTTHPEQLSPSASGVSVYTLSTLTTSAQVHSDSTPVPAPTTTDDLRNTNDIAQGILLAASDAAELRRHGFRFCPAAEGRLSQLRAALRSEDVDLSIRRTVVLPSLRDYRNKETTLCADLKSLLGRCHSLYPNAKLVVVIPAFPPQLTFTEREVLKGFVHVAQEKRPSSSSILRTPANATPTSIRELISGNLNSHL